MGMMDCVVAADASTHAASATTATAAVIDAAARLLHPLRVTARTTHVFL